VAQGLTDDGSHNNTVKQTGRDPSEQHIAVLHDTRIRDRARNLPPLSIRAVNRFGAPGFEPGLQRHHILPLQLLAKDCFARMFEAIGFRRRRFDDFRSNGLLLPGNARTAILMGLPLHRGPHRAYNDLVIERVGQIESRWSSKQAASSSNEAGIEAFYRLDLLQSALRRRLLDPRGKRIALNRSDPAHKQPDFFDLDAMIDKLWAEGSAGQILGDVDPAANDAMARPHSHASRPKRSAPKAASAIISRSTTEHQLCFPGFATDFPLQPTILTCEIEGICHPEQAIATAISGF
jgi:hypothetical protein